MSCRTHQNIHENPAGTARPLGSAGRAKQRNEIPLVRNFYSETLHFLD